ncbi:MAG: hypothetical protein Q8P67_22280, partial [archaeon]|nr:hypothetical protein [archaeon]
VISHHTTASPAIWLLTPDRMEHQLNLAHTEFVQDMVSANVDKGIISLPALFQTYAGDFGGDTRVMDEWVLPHLHPSVRHSVESVLQSPSRQIEYLEDWDIACKPFRSTYV